MRLPGFLVIGAMKAGTTTLLEDLRSHPAIFVGPKEPVCFGYDEVLTQAGRRSYASRFDEARDDQIVGAVSSGSASLPDVEGVAGRARAVLGPALKIIYMVRDPLERALSHHLALVRAGEAGLDVDRELMRRSCYADYSRYAMQLETWAEAFGHDNIVIVWFEKYVRERRATIGALTQWLGTEPRPDLVRSDIVYNRAKDKPVMPWYRLPPAVRMAARLLLPEKVKKTARRRVRPGRLERQCPSEETARRFRALVAEDHARFAALLGYGRPLWGESPPTADSALLRIGGGGEVKHPPVTVPAEPGSAE